MEEPPKRGEARQERHSRGLVDSGGHHAREHHVEDGGVELQVALYGQDEHPGHGLHRHHRHGACRGCAGTEGGRQILKVSLRPQRMW